MSKLVWGCSCAVVMWCVVVSADSLCAQTGAPGEAAAQRIAYTLSQPIYDRMSYDQEQLDIVLDGIEQEYGIQIVFDKSALDEVAISPEATVTIDVDDVSLRAALNLIFTEPGLEELCCVVEDEVLLVTTRDNASTMLVTKVYRADDFDLTNELRSKAFRGASVWADFNPLIDVITSCIEPKSWSESGQGHGEIRLVKPDMLVITQARQVHNKIEALLENLRRTRREVLGSNDDRNASLKPETHGFPIYLQLGENPEQVKLQLVEAIKKSVEWSVDGVDQSGVWIQVLPNRVLVRHIPRVLSQVERVLMNTQILELYSTHRARAPKKGRGAGGGAF